MVGHHRKVGHPRPDFLPILFGHHPRHLSNVSQIVYDPRGEQLPQGDAAEARVHARKVQIRLGQVPGAKNLEVRGPESGEFFQQGRQGSLRIPTPMPEPIVRLKGRIRPPGKDDSGPGNPVRFLPVDEVPDDVERAERLGFAFNCATHVGTFWMGKG